MLCYFLYTKYIEQYQLMVDLDLILTNYLSYPLMLIILGEMIRDYLQYLMPLL